MTKEELKTYLVEETECYEWYEVNAMTPAELVDAYLAWNGIINWTDDTLKVVKAAYEINV
jgi:hypothetical protein